MIVTAVFHFRPASRDAVLAALRPAVSAVHEELGCELYALHEAVDGSFVLIEKWESVELLDAHGSSPAVETLVGAIGEHLTAPVDVTRLTGIPMGTDAQGAL
ncbi:hypothetical protein A20C1_12572 [marine actinobacterium PHSC20C1]|nr:hypothetical protein A20C1_12572 [marine actinobacterium PHSC20C1]